MCQTRVTIGLAGTLKDLTKVFMLRGIDQPSDTESKRFEDEAVRMMS